MLKLKLQYFGHLMWINDSFQKTLMLKRLKAGRDGDNRGWDGWMASLTQWTWVWVNSWSWRWTGRSGLLQSMGSQRVRHNWVTKLNWNLSMNVIYQLVLVGVEAAGFPSVSAFFTRICLQCRRLRRRCMLDVGKTSWSRKWQPTLVFLPGKFHGQRSLVGCSPWGHTGSDMTEATEHHTQYGTDTF